MSKLSFIFNMQLCGFHYITRYSICIVVIFAMYFYCFGLLLCVPQGVPVANKCQMSSNINILYDSYQEWLKHQTFTTFQVKFHVSGSIINFCYWLVMTCVIPSQCYVLSLLLMPVVQMHCSSVEAYLLWKCCWACWYVFS